MEWGRILHGGRSAAPGPVPACGRCRHFSNAPRMLEREIPGLVTMSSADAAVRDQDGLCALRGRLASPRSHCKDFTP